MSNWTHVAAIVRIDAFRESLNQIDFAEKFGKTLHYSDPEDRWVMADKHPEMFLPLGSEGSLEMLVYENPDLGCMAAYTISIFGDLRDHHNPDKIITWFKEKCSKFVVRNASIIVENEINGIRTWHYPE